MSAAVIFFAIAPGLTHADDQFSDQTCDDYETRHARQLKFDKDAALHDKIINLCGQPAFDKAMDDLKIELSYFKDTILGNPRFLVERVHHHMLSSEVDDILKYPNLKNALEDCYPGNAWKQFSFIYELRKDDYNNLSGALAGIAVQYGIFKGGGALVGRFLGTGRALTTYKWLFYPTAFSIYELVQWSRIPTNQSSAVLTRVDSPNTTDPIVERIEAAKVSGTHRASTSSAFKPSLFTEPINASATDENVDIVNYLRMKANVCLNSIGNYLRAQAVGYGQTIKAAVQTTCKNYVTEVRDGLEKLRDKHYACLPANRGGTQKVLADFDVFLQQFPIELLENLK